MIFYAYFFCCLSQNNYLCTLIFSHLLNMLSHPTWVRGLKQSSTGSNTTWKSRTLRGCVDWNIGKVSISLQQFESRTLRGCVDWNLYYTFLPSGSTSRTLRGCVDWNRIGSAAGIPLWRRTLRGCVDWNFWMLISDSMLLLSHPTWVRGLKQTIKIERCTLNIVAPYVGAWIETRIYLKARWQIRSHPTWVRGLKHLFQYQLKVAQKSHPTWVRGLKRLIFLESKTFYTLTIYPNTSKFTKSNYSKACCLHSCSSNVLNWGMKEMRMTILFYYLIFLILKR